LAELKFLGYLAEIAGAREKILVLDKPMPLRRVLPPSFPEKNVIILIDKKVGNLDSVIENESSVILMPMLSGG
jgi:molybdopterin converting factor small subunit